MSYYHQREEENMEQQLKRLERENSKLRSELAEARKIINGLQSGINRLFGVQQGQQQQLQPDDNTTLHQGQKAQASSEPPKSPKPPKIEKAEYWRMLGLTQRTEPSALSSMRYRPQVEESQVEESRRSRRKNVKSRYNQLETSFDRVIEQQRWRRTEWGCPKVPEATKTQPVVKVETKKQPISTKRRNYLKMGTTKPITAPEQVKPQTPPPKDTPPEPKKIQPKKPGQKRTSPLVSRLPVMGLGRRAGAFKRRKVEPVKKLKEKPKRRPGPVKRQGGRPVRKDVALERVEKIEKVLEKVEIKVDKTGLQEKNESKEVFEEPVLIDVAPPPPPTMDLLPPAAEIAKSEENAKSRRLAQKPRRIWTREEVCSEAEVIAVVKEPKPVTPPTKSTRRSSEPKEFAHKFELQRTDRGVKYHECYTGTTVKDEQGTKRFKCYWCAANFASRQVVRSHTERHHQEQLLLKWNELIINHSNIFKYTT